MKKALLIICIGSLIIGCSISPTKPNISAIYRVSALKAQLRSLPAKSQQLTQGLFPIEAQKLLQKLYILDPTLAFEVGKLPEFQGKVDERQIRALTRFTELIANITPEEKINLAMLLEVGKPNIRRYCTPLQAIFWVFEEEEPYLEPNPLHYSLEDILHYVWDYSEKRRWSDFEIVTERLNSPELINYYEQKNFWYVDCEERVAEPKAIFKYKNGCCFDYSAFSEYCLQKAGYDAKIIKVESPNYHSYHVVCEFIDKDGKEYIMDNSCRPCGLGITDKKKYTRRLPQIGY